MRNRPLQLAASFIRGRAGVGSGQHVPGFQASRPVPFRCRFRQLLEQPDNQLVLLPKASASSAFLWFGRFICRQRRRSVGPNLNGGHHSTIAARFEKSGSGPFPSPLVPFEFSSGPF